MKRAGSLRYRKPIPKHSKRHFSGNPVFAATDFPKPWLYYGTNGFGYPIMGSSWAAAYDPGNFNDAIITSIARFPLVTINAHPFASTGASDGPNRAIISRLKALRPTMKILWYDTHVQAIDYLTVGSQWYEMRNASIGPPDVRLYDTGGLLAPWLDQGVWFFDTGRVKSTLLSIWLAHGGTAHDADGFFLDYAWGTLYVGTESGDPIDLTRTAWTTAAELDASGKAGLDYVVDGLAAQGFEVWANGIADADSKARWDGNLFEGWYGASGMASGGTDAPAGFASFDLAMTDLLTWQGSTATGDGSCLTKTENNGISWNSATWRKACRFTIGSAAIGGGYGYTGDNRNINHLTTDDANMWADEYSVLSGVSETTGAGIGWLGRPTEFGYKTGSVYVRHFDNGMVVVNGDGTTAHTYDPGSGYRKIQGIYDTTVNDGTAIQTTQTIPGKDARFWLRG